MTAPVSGKVSRKSAVAGMYVQVGQTLMALVPDQYWVIGNFKETQVTHMQPGDPVEISIDAYPDKVFQGHVESLQAGTGAVFSVLPPENATGNYVKVVQRIPVKIVFNEDPDPRHPFAIGMSVVPEVEVK
jgi:membrane fusion protein (multidrug efflux system)